MNNEIPLPQLRQGDFYPIRTKFSPHNGILENSVLYCFVYKNRGDDFLCLQIKNPSHMT